MKKQIALFLCVLLLVSLLAGCGSARPEVPDAAQEGSAAPAEPETAPEEALGRFEFQPKVVSSYMRELFGEEMCEVWFRMVDAVLAGETSFVCPDKDTFDWVIGQFPDQCFPVLRDLIDYSAERDPNEPVVDGVGYFRYTEPVEEVQAKIAEFAALVEGILNETMQTDYSDFEKMLALYAYFSDHYTYDYEAYADSQEGYPDYLSSYRVLTTGTGICQELSVAYAYLLLQAGVDATNMSGTRGYDGEHHQWSYVRLNGRNYHIDPTYVLGSGMLNYFLMDDAQREAEDDYAPERFIICSNYAQDHPHPDYCADDDTFRPIWEGYYDGFDHETHTLRFHTFDDAGEQIDQTFDYTGY